ncbi:uncharacterized protein L969DRAFT_95673 [Mixia osmundae IAM 14324]|uniref:Secreted protein n=1 Tax=Mixia osmundae (strain CBS 9802 / IAM 14324 / JCM 22182 / KY 12970) TaxID=764103 RepID=G7E838_MIXOS|nr:uncharacterized protein L969DRAFT_95673 [Mixia osmundae IAM 14324]KEI38598.1 hypothetical protein L969DRAFT_95673 [Mixia osmundae IAM 14324]GAA98998.1 hypothetical protein E5Q_05687 [Mixia osmundae IAM 14324]
MKLIAAWAILASLACVMAGQASLIVQFKDGKSYTSPKLECGLQTNLPKYWDSPPAAVTYRGPSRDADLPDYMTQYDCPCLYRCDHQTDSHDSRLG